jgi:hypothetical protein
MWEADRSDDVGWANEYWSIVSAAVAIIGGVFAGIAGALFIAFVRTLSSPASLLRLRMAHSVYVARSARLRRPGGRRPVVIGEIRNRPTPPVARGAEGHTEFRQTG